MVKFRITTNTPSAVSLGGWILYLFRGFKPSWRMLGGTVFYAVPWDSLLPLSFCCPDPLEDLEPIVRVGLALGSTVAVMIFPSLVLSLTVSFLLFR